MLSETASRVAPGLVDAPEGSSGCTCGMARWVNMTLVAMVSSARAKGARGGREDGAKLDVKLEFGCEDTIVFH